MLVVFVGFGGRKDNEQLVVPTEPKYPQHLGDGCTDCRDLAGAEIMDSPEVIVGNSSLTKISSSYTFPLISEKWNISCHINKQGCHSHQLLQSSNMTRWSLKEHRKEKNTCYLATIRQQPLPKVSPRETGCEKHKILAPDSWGLYQRDGVVRPDSCIFPHIKKALNSSTQVVWFSLINNNLLMYRLPTLCCKTSI